ncbi:MAG: RNA polymerase sigma factor [Planctomycetaceae bacterium]|nr:MAG: RNA polymerase sigma factor [Planctomycetaceae bacterium]
MLRVKQGEEEAFAQLVRIYQDRLINIFYHLVGSQEAAEDLAQEVFLRVYRARHGYEPTAKFCTYLFCVANNLASNLRRDQGRRREVAFPLTESGPQGVRPEEKLLIEKSGALPTRQLDRQELQQLVQQALLELNERQRLAVLLHKFEGLSYQEIAEAMEMSPAAVKSLLARARERLREILEPYMHISKG